MAVPAGTRLGRYEVLSSLGAGGMGEVYLARDSRLGRQVAVKVLAGRHALDDLAVARFTREAHAIAALNHPNICSVHDVGEWDEAPFLVMEHLEGETLAARLSRGPCDVETWLEIALALSDALEHAHAAGVIHRDLKPANVFLTRTGQPKILDFGLAKAAVTSDTTTTSADVLTAAGAQAGTLAYMSPEQLRGEPLDPRSDIFSLGLVLYEMATGRRAFAGSTGPVIATSILNTDPLPARSVRPELPPDVDRILLKTLEKDRDLRYQSAADLRSDVKRLRRDASHRGTPSGSSAFRPAGHSAGAVGHADTGRRPGSGADASPHARGRVGRRWRIALPAVVLLAAILAAAVAWRARSRAPSAGSTAFPHLEVQPLTFSGDVRFPAISPDGRFVAFVRQDALWIRQVSAASADRDVLLAARAEGRLYQDPSITPDGEHVDVVVVQGDTRELWRVPLLGGGPRSIANGLASGIAWSPDGTTMAFVRTGANATALVTADSSGSNQRALVTGEPARRFKATRPAWSPQGDEILVIGGSFSPAQGDPQLSELIFVDAGSGAVRRRHPTGLREVRQARWLDRNRLILETGIGFFTSLWAADLRGDDWRPITREFAALGDFDATADRNTAVVLREERRTGIWSIGPGGGDPRLVVAESGSGPGYPVLDDSGGVLYSALLNDGSFGVYRVAPDDPRSVLVTSGILAPDSWTATRDGRVVVFTGHESTYPLRRVNVDGSGLTTLVARDAAGPAVTPDGRTVIFSPLKEGILSVPLQGGPVRTVSNRAICCAPVISPDGRSMLVGSVGQAPVICALPDCSRPTEVRFQRAPAEHVPPRWAPEGRGIAFVPANDVANIWEQPLDGTPPRRLTQLAERPILDFAWSPDGTRLVMSRGQYQTDMVLLRGLLHESDR